MTEIKTAEGYNLLSESVPFEVTANGVTYTVNGQPKAGKRIETEGKISFQMIIPNSAGTELPLTGGIGTTIFYILGSLLVVGCGIMLISRRRTDAKK